MIDLPGNQYPIHRCWLKVLPKEHSAHRKNPLPTYKRWLYTWTSPDGQHQNKIRFIIFFAAEDGEAVYSQQKQDRVLIVVQIMSSLLQNSGLNWRTQGKPLGFPGSSAGKKSACNAGDSGSIPGLGRSPGEGIGYPLQYSWASLGLRQ